MIAPDSSVLIAGYVPVHPSHAAAEACLGKVRGSGRLIAHTMAETYAVLTAAAGPYEAPADSVITYLSDFLTHSPVGVPPARYERVLAELARAEVTGGAVYDGLIAVAARDAGLQLASLDRRAKVTYRRVGVELRILDA